MTGAEKKILSTKPIPETAIQQGRAHHIFFDSVHFIETKPRTEAALIEKIKAYAGDQITAIFTSENAVNAVLPALGIKPNWKIFCISGKTKTTLLRYFDEGAIAGSAPNGSELSELIILQKPARCVFFCGNKRLPTIPEVLRHNGITLSECVVYDTLFSPKKINEHYAGILFFSPSAVESFFLMNKIDQGTVLFAVGKTTEKAIRTFTDHEVVTAAFPGMEEMIKLVTGYRWNEP